ncbi:MAG TPA: FecR family protein [Steroidobacteraceae bacterium]|nr:FecR family protein [Steroidobacteraceae bacterium]
MNTPTDDERETAALLAQLKVAPPPAARERAFAKLQAEFAAQHAPAVASPSSRRSRVRWAVAAGVVVALLAGLTWRGSQPRDLVARVESIDGNVESRGAGWLDGRDALADGGTVAAGSTLQVAAQGGVLLRLSPDLTVRLAGNTRARFVAADRLELSAGQAFVDATPGAHAPLRIVTPYGEVTHLGTQYLVRVGADTAPHEVEVAVREGRAQLTIGQSQRVAEAGHWLLRRDGAELVEGTIDPVDARFEWIGKLPSSFKLEGATLAGFLAWFQRETGLAPIYSDGVDAGQFSQVQLKGSIDELEPVEALSYVLATADLAWHREGAKVVIEKRRAAAG